MTFRLPNRNPLPIVWRWCAALAVGVLFSCVRAEPVTLQLRNGDRLSGEFVSMSTTNVVITNAFLGRLSIPIDSVERLEKRTAANLAASATNAAPQKLALPGPAATNQIAAVTPPPAVTPPAPALTNVPAATAAITSPPPPRPVSTKHWTADIQFGTDLEFNQTQRELYYGRFKWTYGLDRFRALLDYIANYGVNAGIISANDMTGSARVELDLAKSKKWFAYDSLATGYNEIRKIDFFLNESLGMGYKFITRTNFSCSMDLGLNYQHQVLSDGTVKDFEGIRIGEQATWTINSRWSLDEKIDCLPQYSGSEDFQTRLEVNLRYLILSTLTLNFTIINFYDTQPAPGVSKNDLLLRGTIGVKF